MEPRALRKSTTKGNTQEQVDLQMTVLCAPHCLHLIAPWPSNSVEFSTFSMINPAPIPTLPYTISKQKPKQPTKKKEKKKKSVFCLPKPLPPHARILLVGSRRPKESNQVLQLGIAMKCPGYLHKPFFLRRAVGWERSRALPAMVRAINSELNQT